MKPAEQRPIERYFHVFDQNHRNKANLIIQYIALPLLLLSVIGLAWSLPFPHLGFLGSYNGYINWASIIIAVLIYYYLKLSPLLSYCMLFVLFGFSYLIIQFEQWHKAGGPPLGLTSVVLLVVALVALIIGQNKEKHQRVLILDFKLLVIGPLWLLYKLLSRFSIRY
jgi:uncharacterized membrane protein YGL010W